MIQSDDVKGKLVISVFFLLIGAHVLAAVPVEQRSVGDGVYVRSTQGLSSAPMQQSNQSSDPLWEVLNQLEALQAEVLALRGLVEQQAYQLDQLQQQQKQHYIDLDQRIEASSGQGSGSLRTVSSPVSSAEVASPEAIKSMYDSGMKHVKDRAYSQAEAQFRQILREGQGSFYVPFAHYWLGEVLLAQKPSDLDQARQHFQQVIDQFPGHSKVAPSLYKLGVIYNAKGDKTLAKSTLKQVIQRFPGTSESNMASQFLETSL